MISFSIVLISFSVFWFIVRKKEFWQKRVSMRLPVLVGGFYLLFSIPALLKLSDNIHDLYGLLYGFLNLPVIYIFGQSGIIDKLEISVFASRSLTTSNLLFAGVSFIFWMFVSFLVGFIVDLNRFLGR